MHSPTLSTSPAPLLLLPAIVLLVGAGCGGLDQLLEDDSTPPAAEDRSAQTARAAFERAREIAASTPLTPELARQGRDAARDCSRAISSVIGMQSSHGVRAYDAERETIPTAHGTYTLQALEDECDGLEDTLVAADLRPAPTPSASDPSLEAQMLAVLHNEWRDSSVQLRKVVITSSDWSMIRHPETGVLTGRSRAAQAGGSWPDGHCSYQRVTFEQQHDGSDFVAAVNLRGVGSQYRVACTDL